MKFIFNCPTSHISHVRLASSVRTKPTPTSGITLSFLTNLICKVGILSEDFMRFSNRNRHFCLISQGVETKLLLFSRRVTEFQSETPTYYINLNFLRVINTHNFSHVELSLFLHTVLFQGRLMTQCVSAQTSRTGSVTLMCSSNATGS